MYILRNVWEFLRREGAYGAGATAKAFTRLEHLGGNNSLKQCFIYKAVVILEVAYEDGKVAVRLKFMRCEQAADAAADDDDVNVEGSLGRGRGSGYEAEEKQKGECGECHCDSRG